jgi:hypothetical protein
MAETVESKLQPPREEIITEAIRVVRKVRKHIQQESCQCCREALGD